MFELSHDMCVMIVSAVLLSNTHAGGVYWHVETANGGFEPGPPRPSPQVFACAADCSMMFMLDTCS